MHTSNDAPMTKPRGTHLRPTIENLGVQNLETLIGPFLVRTTLRVKKMEAEIIWLCALGTSCQVSLSEHSLKGNDFPYRFPQAHFSSTRSF
jgi:hypothetical protein